MDTRFKIGDRVKVIDNEYVYDTYANFFSENNITDPNILLNWNKYITVDPYHEFTVRYIGEHAFTNDTVVLIENDNNDFFLMNSKGLELDYDVVDKMRDKVAYYIDLMLAECADEWDLKSGDINPTDSIRLDSVERDLASVLANFINNNR